MVKKQVKPTSVRFEDSLLSKIDDKCNKLGCSRNNFIKSSIETQLDTSTRTCNFTECTNCDNEIHEIYKKVIGSIHEADSSSFEDDDKGRPSRFSAEWIYDG